MKTIFIIILLTFVLIKRTNSVPFCEIKTLDNVFNIGHLVYLTRCGEVWTYNPRMDGGAGGLTRDYAIYTFARRRFGLNIDKQDDSQQIKRYLRFAAFSFQEVSCKKSDEDLHRKCGRAVDQWNSLTVIADNVSAVTFRYDSEFKVENNWNNPLNLSLVEDISPENPNRNKFWPNIMIVGKSVVPPYQAPAIIHSALFDVENSILYIVLKANDYFCITYLNMLSMLHDLEQLPRHSTSSYKPDDWAEGFCFTGDVVGIFKDRNEVLIAGRVDYTSRQFEDQVYGVVGAKNRETVSIVPKVRSHIGDNYNLRTWFGCRGSNPQNSETSYRKRRSLEDTDKRLKTRQTYGSIGFDISAQFREDFTQLSFLSIVSLILIYTIVRLLAIIRKQSKNLDKYKFRVNSN